MRKRGQVTILIILGLVILSSIIMVYMFREKIFLSEFERQKAESLQVPQQAAELHDYIGDCVQEVIQEPINLIGQQGGYITLPNDPIGQGMHNQFSNSLEIFPGTDFETAYWFYEAANGVPRFQAPAKVDMELQIADYINQHLPLCADDQEIFERYNAEVGEVFAEVEILDDEVQVIVDYPVTVELEEYDFNFDSFYESIDVPLGSMFDSAVEIMNEENENYYLEELTYDMFVLNENLPLSWSEVDCDRETWEVAQVEDDLKNTIFQNLLAVKLRKTDYEIKEETDKNYFEWSALKKSTDYRANLLYSPNWPLEMKVYPAEDGILTEDSYTDGANPIASFMKNLFCVTSYNFIYDIKYPVLVSLYDEDSDYTFQFATMVVVDNNQPRENELGTLEIEDVGESRICNDATIPITIFPVMVDDFGEFVDLGGADVSFKCINSQCPIGTTTRTQIGLETIVPQCINAQIIVEKEGYNRGMEIVDTLEETTVTVVLEQFKNLTYEVKVIDPEGNVRTPTSDETLFVTLAEQDTGYTTTVSHPRAGETITLIPGTYDVVGTMISDAPFDIKIPGSTFKTCSAVPILGLGGLFGTAPDTSCSDVQVDDIELEQSLSGGIELVWVADRDDLRVARHVTFYVTSPGSPDSLEELEEALSFIDTGIGQREPQLS
jgi:hypothetical protein